MLPGLCAGLVLLFWIIPLYSEPWNFKVRHSKGGKGVIRVYLVLSRRLNGRHKMALVSQLPVFSRHRVTRASQPPVFFSTIPVQEGVVYKAVIKSLIFFFPVQRFVLNSYNVKYNTSGCTFPPQTRTSLQANVFPKL